MFVRRRRWNSLKLLLWFLFQHPRLISPVVSLPALIGRSQLQISTKLVVVVNRPAADVSSRHSGLRNRRSIKGNVKKNTSPSTGSGSIKGNVKKNTSPSTGSGEELLDFQPCQR